MERRSGASRAVAWTFLTSTTSGSVSVAPKKGIRKRLTPASLRFLGQRVYLGLIVVLVPVLRHGSEPDAGTAAAGTGGGEPAHGALVPVVAQWVGGDAVSLIRRHT